MIKNITLENFFSFGNRQTIELNAGVNVLVGINGSGKSNFIRAIELLKEGASENGFEEIFQKKWSGFSGVKNLGKDVKEDIHLWFGLSTSVLKKSGNHNTPFNYPSDIIDYNIDIYPSGKTSYVLREILIDKHDSYVEKDYPYLQSTSNDSYAQIFYKNNDGNIEEQEYSKKSIKNTNLFISQISDPERFKVLSLIQKAIKSISLYSNFDTTFNSPIRNLNSYQSETKLRSDGSNLVSLLQKIKNNHTLEFEKIEEAFAQINPHFKSIDFDYLGSKFQLVIREKNLSKTITAEHISDGTLRFLLLLSILYNPERGNLVCLDEPETGLHPDMIRTIAKAIKYAANQGTQVILATHSPLLLNHFEIDDVLIFEKNEHNETVVSTKEEDDFEDWNDSYSTGKLWIDGKLGGVRW